MNSSTTIEHFTHPGHPLRELKSDTQYLCNGCKTLGTGTRFRCNICNYDFHEYCCKCPESLSSFMHPHNQLALLMCTAQGTHTNIRTCNVCGESIEGTFYCCRDCEFEVHPICTQLPQYLCHALHLAHSLMLHSSETATCAVCRGVCNSWRYRCGVCDGCDIHFECVLVSCDTTTRQRHGPTPPPYAPPPYGAGDPNPYYNMYNNYQAPGYNMHNAYGGVPSGLNPYHMAYANNYQVPAYNVHNYQASGYNTYNSYVGAPSSWNPYNMAYANNYQVPAYNVHNYQAPGYNTYNAYVGVPSGSNPYNMAYANNYQVPAYNVHNYEAPGYNTYSDYVGVPSCSNSYNMAYANNYQVPAYNVHNNPNQAQQPQGIMKPMFKIASTLALGVLSNVIFGLI